MSFETEAQTYVYSYVDPCTGVLKEMDVPEDGVTVNYYGEIQNFQQIDFTNGNFNNWANNVYNNFGSSNPCGSTLGVSTTLNIAQTTTINTLNLLTSISALSDLRGGLVDVTSGIKSTDKIEKEEKEEKENSDNKSSDKINNSSNTNKSNNTSDNNNSNTSNNPNSSNSSNKISNNTNTSNSNSSNNTNTSNSNNSNSNNTNNSNTNTSNSNSNNTNNSNTNTNNNSSNNNSNNTNNSNTNTNNNSSNNSSNNTNNPSSSSNGSNSSNNNSNTNTNKNETDNKSSLEVNTDDKKTDIINGSVTSIKKSSEGSGNAPSVVLSSDFAGFNFVDNETSFGGKGTAGFTSMRWDGLRTGGVMVDYNSMVGLNINGFMGFINEKRINIISLSLTTSFVGRGSLYGTLSYGQMREFKKVKYLKVIYMATASFGNVYKEGFVGTALIAGGMYDIKVGKRLDLKITGLYIYSPYVSYYDDIVLKSPHVIMPLLGTNFSITKKFKISTNFGGTYSLGENVMNYTIMFGTRIGI